MRLYEDFVPISDVEALVTTGERLDRLDRIERRRYRLVGVYVQVANDGEVLVEGERLRLGGLFDGDLLYSDASGIVGCPEFGRTAHQPTKRGQVLYYTDGPLESVSIYRQGQEFIGAFGDMVQVGNPCWAEGRLYFEARSDPDPARPDLWQICREPGRREQFEVLWPGANPAYWNGKLFWGEWNGRSFDYRWREL